MLGWLNKQFQESPSACCNSASECKYFGCLDSHCGTDARSPNRSNLPATCLAVALTASASTAAPLGVGLGEANVDLSSSNTGVGDGLV